MCFPALFSFPGHSSRAARIFLFGISLKGLLVPSHQGRSTPPLITLAQEPASSKSPLFLQDPFQTIFFFRPRSLLVKIHAPLAAFFSRPPALFTVSKVSASLDVSCVLAKPPWSTCVSLSTICALLLHFFPTSVPTTLLRVGPAAVHPPPTWRGLR